MIRNDIVVGIDGSPSARAALHWAAEHARRQGAPLRAVYVFDPPLGSDARGRPFVLEDLVFRPDDEVPAGERIDMNALFAEVRPGADWRIEFVRGEAGRVLVEESRHSRLLVIGSHEHVGLGRVLNGSVSHFCLSHATCPVVAVPSPRVPKGSTDEPTP